MQHFHLTNINRNFGHYEHRTTIDAQICLFYGNWCGDVWAACEKWKMPARKTRFTWQHFFVRRFSPRLTHDWQTSHTSFVRPKAAWLIFIIFSCRIVKRPYSQSILHAIMPYLIGFYDIFTMTWARTLLCTCDFWPSSNGQNKNLC